MTTEEGDGVGEDSTTRCPAKVELILELE